MPSIGPSTIEGVARAGLAGIAVAAEARSSRNRERMTKAADKAKIRHRHQCRWDLMDRSNAPTAHDRAGARIFLVAAESRAIDWARH